MIFGTFCGVSRFGKMLGDGAGHVLFFIRMCFFIWIFSSCRPMTPCGSEINFSFIVEIPLRKLVRRQGIPFPLHNLSFVECERWGLHSCFPAYAMTSASSRSLQFGAYPSRMDVSLMMIQSYSAVSSCFLVCFYVLVWLVCFKIFGSLSRLGPVDVMVLAISGFL